MKTNQEILQWLQEIKKDNPKLYKQILEAVLDQIQKELGK